MKRRRTALVFLAAVVLAALGGWWLGTTITTPAEIAAQTAAPEPSPILVPAERRVLSTDVVTRGTGRFGSPIEVGVVASLLKDSTRVVTGLPELGSDVAEGAVLFSTSGRPSFLLQGALPAYRDLGPGMIGDDVTQLEAALARLGHDPGPQDGAYDAATEAAVTSFYESRDHEPAIVSSSQLADVRPPESEIFDGSFPQAGVVVPADEVVFVPTLPVRVAEITTGLGQPVEGAVLMITDANVSIDGSLPIEQSGLVVAGMPVRIDEPDLGIQATGVVSQVAETPGTNGLDGFHVYFEVQVEDAPANLINASVRLTIPIESTSDQVLVVPVTALTLAPDGASQVQVDRNGTLRSLAVSPGLSAQGFVEVTPIDGELAEGDMVLVGYDNGVQPSA